MNKLKNFLHYNFPTATRRDFILWVAVIISTIFGGLLVVLLSFREGIDFGDGSTFFQFAHNLSSGEVIYKDFIHFRTPGSYFLQSLFIHIFGDQQSSVRLALGVEAQVLYPFLFLLAIAVFLKFKAPFLGLIVAPLVVMLPAYAQLRTVLALIAVVLYIQSYRTIRKNFWLVASGVFLGLSFTFGQEAGAIGVVVIGLSEIIIHFKKIKVKMILRRMGLLMLGALIGVLPLMVYVVTFSDIANFFYYTLYYAFILQPQGMNLTFPHFEFANLIFYLVFVVYVLCFYVFYSSRHSGWPDIIFLAFVITRSITLLGRSDIPHLIFVLPELLFLILYCVYRLRHVSFSVHRLAQFAPYGIGLLVSFYAAMHLGSQYIVASVAIVLLAFRSRDNMASTHKVLLSYHSMLVQFLLGGSLILLLYMMYPHYKSTYSTMTKRGLTQTQIDGVNIDEGSLRQISAVQAVVDTVDPEVIFSYPIQPFYYRFAPKHATRFITYEPQTTVKEQAQSIDDLKKSKPDIVIYDPIQAESMNDSLGKINNYVVTNYKVIAVINETRLLWIMVPKDK